MSSKNQKKLNIMRSLFWVGLSLCFNLILYFQFGPSIARDFFAGYVIEKLLSIDNLFVFLSIFSFFQIAEFEQRRILNWGILGAFIARGCFVWLGAEMLEHFHFMIYVMGTFLMGTGVHMAWAHDRELNLESSWVLQALKRVLPLRLDVVSGWFLKIEGRIYATRLFFVLLLIEGTDVLFAIDSVPAVLSITSNPWVVYSSNVFAILGLRSLYFIFQDLVHSLPGLQQGVSAVLFFVGFKMLVSDRLPISTGLALAIIFCILIGTIVCIRIKSWYRTRAI